MTDESKRVDLNESAQPEAVPVAQQESTRSEHSEALASGREGKFSAQPDAMDLLGKSIQPDATRPVLEPDGIGASTQPEAIPLTTQQAAPPPPADED